MRNRSTWLTLVAGLVMVVAACTGGTSPTPGSSAPAASGSFAPLKVGVVTDVGQLEDKSFNQFTNEGALEAATTIGGTHDVIVTANISDYAANIDTFAQQDYDVIVTAGSLLGTATAEAAKRWPDIMFVGIDQTICLNPDGTPNFADCSGDAATLLPNYHGVVFAEEQAGYLAGIVAASITETDVIGAVGGTNVRAVVAFNAGYQAGAKSVNPSITTLYQEADPDPAKGFNNPALGKTIAGQMISQENADVLFQIAGGTGVGVLEETCERQKHGIGVDVDQALSIPTAAGCIVTSAEKKLKEYTNLVVLSAAAGTFEGGEHHYNAASEPPAIGLAPYHDFESLITPEIQAKIDEAFEAMKAGTLTPPSK